MRHRFFVLCFHCIDLQAQANQEYLQQKLQTQQYYTFTMAEEIRTESMYVLYGSQTGNSEQAAKDFCTELEEKFTPKYFEDMGLSPVKITTNCLQLDDFLEYEHSAFTKTMIVFVSSYGVGQAPMGSYKFRSFAEELLSQTESGKLSSDFLKGLSYAVCGLGKWWKI